MDAIWYLCRLDEGKPVLLWGPQIPLFRRLGYAVVIV